MGLEEDANSVQDHRGEDGSFADMCILCSPEPNLLVHFAQGFLNGTRHPMQPKKHIQDNFEDAQHVVIGQRYMHSECEERKTKYDGMGD